MTLYSARTIPTGFRMVKWDDDLNVEAIYDMKQTSRATHCSCFQSNKPSCRHREMLKVFQAKKAVNKGRFYDFDHKRWYPALKEP